MTFINSLEPEFLVNTFLNEPPKGFKPIYFDETNIIPAFLTKFNLLTTMDGLIKKFLIPISFFIPKPRTLFIGTTVSEYALFPNNFPKDKIIDTIYKKFLDSKASFLIIKDLPLDSTLLTSSENDFNIDFAAKLQERHFIILSGEALAFVPIDFLTIDDYLKRFSKSRRKDLKRKLKSLNEITIEKTFTGTSFFDEQMIQYLYKLYLNVYNDSYIHFDKLSLNFFKKLFEDTSSQGLVFLYKTNEKIIGFNLCYIHNNSLIDKYVGFIYPDAKTFNLYFLSWFENLKFCIENKLNTYIAGWTDPEIKGYLGAKFTFTHHAVYIKNPLLRLILKKLKSLFESDKRLLERISKKLN